MTDLPPETIPADASAQRDALLRDSDFVTRWNSGDRAAMDQISKLDAVRVNGGGTDDRPRPPSAAGTATLLSPTEARALAQASIDRGGDVAAIKAALAATDPDWQPDLRPLAERQWADDHAVNHPERYSVPTDRYFRDDLPQEREALDGVVRSFVATVGLDRSGGSDLAETITRTMAELRDARPEARALYAQAQQARLGDKGPALIADAAKALTGVDQKLLELMRRSGALDNADVIASLAFMAQARAANG